jgi:hypothetical protein
MNFDHFKKLILSSQAQRPKALRPFFETFCKENQTSKSALCSLAGLDSVSERELAKKYGVKILEDFWLILTLLLQPKM